VYWH